MVVPSGERGFMEVNNRPRTGRSARAALVPRARLEAGAHGPGWYRAEGVEPRSGQGDDIPGFPTPRIKAYGDSGVEYLRDARRGSTVIPKKSSKLRRTCQMPVGWSGPVQGI